MAVTRRKLVKETEINSPPLTDWVVLEMSWTRGASEGAATMEIPAGKEVTLAVPQRVKAVTKMDCVPVADNGGVLQEIKTEPPATGGDSNTTKFDVEDVVAVAAEMALPPETVEENAIAVTFKHAPALPKVTEKKGATRGGALRTMRITRSPPEPV